MLSNASKNARSENGFERKLRIIDGLYELAFKVKKFQLQEKFPHLSDKELNQRTGALIEKGCK